MSSHTQGGSDAAHPAATLQEIAGLAGAGRLDAAAAACDRMLATHPQYAKGWLLASQVRQRLRDFDGMLDASVRAAGLLPSDGSARLRHVECLVYCGRTGDALGQLASLESTLGDDPRRLLDIGTYYTHCNRHLEAHRCYARAAMLDPAQPVARAAVAASASTLGRLEEAEALLEALVADRPQYFDAWVNLANVRRWTPEHNHVECLERLLRAPHPPAAEPPLCYALFKELEDLGEHARAFAYLERGATARRRALRYRVERDLDAMRTIRTAFPGERLHAPARRAGGDAIFVMGLPRSGTTLVDRILCSHPAVESLGELRDLTFAVMRLAGPGAPGQLRLIERSAGIDFDGLGTGYLDAIAAYRGPSPRFVDKTPANYLYAGLIRLALPDARMILLRRHPLDACFAMYKTLFQAGYPFSYDLEDLGRYYVEWHNLMSHWREAMPDAIHEVGYESLVGDQEGQTRRLLAHCGLDWDDRCLQFHENPAPAATASAAQVRRPLYDSSVGRWRHHEAALEPLARILRDAGLVPD